MKKLIVVITSALSVLLICSIFTAFAENSFRTKVVLTIEETTYSSTNTQKVTQNSTLQTYVSKPLSAIESTNADNTQSSAELNVQSRDKTFLRTGSNMAFASVAAFFVMVISIVAVLWITKRNKRN